MEVQDGGFDANPVVPLVDFIRHPPTPPPSSRHRPVRSSATKFELSRDELALPYRHEVGDVYTLAQSASVTSKSAFAFFVDERKIAVDYNNRDIEYRVIDFYDECEVIWDATPREEKERFTVMAEVEKQRVIADLEEQSARARVIRHPPRRAKGPFRFFCDKKMDAVKARFPNGSIGIWMKTLGEMWQRAPGRLKERCENEAIIDRLRYQDEMREFENPQ